MSGVLLVLVLAVGVALVLWAVPRWSERRRKSATKPNPKNDLMWQYIVALLSTLAGVYLALFLSRVDAQRVEKRAADERESADRQLAARLLRKAEGELFELEQDVRTLYWMDGRRVHEMLRFTPIGPPRTVEAVLANDVVLRLGSEDGFASIRGALSQVASAASIVNSTRGDTAAVRSNLDVLGMTCRVLRHWVSAERRHVLGEWTDGERNAYGNRWTMREVSGKGDWAELRSVPVVVRPGALRTSIGHVREVDLLFDSLPPPPFGQRP